MHHFSYKKMQIHLFSGDGTAFFSSVLIPISDFIKNML